VGLKIILKSAAYALGRVISGEVSKFPSTSSSRCASVRFPKGLQQYRKHDSSGGNPVYVNENRFYTV